MPDTSAGLLMYRLSPKGPEFFLVHPGGPFWAARDEGAWSLPKGVVNSGEDLIVAAKREFFEETGLKSAEPFIPLGTTQLRSGKIIHAWAFHGDWHGMLMCSTHVRMEWPARSRKFIKFPEVDRAGFFPLDIAKRKIHPAQAIFLQKLQGFLKLENKI